MNTKSRKAKGRALQNWVRDKLISLFPHLTSNDIRSTPMGCTGADVMLSEEALKVFPYEVECKNAEAINVWKAYAQCEGHGGLESLLIIKRNYHKPLAVVDADYFLKMIGERNAHVGR